jgi:hypothetical protein
LFPNHPHTAAMSFQDVEAGLSNIESPMRNTQSPEEAAFANLQSSLSMQVFKIDNNVRGILKLVDQLGTQRDSPSLRKSLYVTFDIPYFAPLNACLTQARLD